MTALYFRVRNLLYREEGQDLIEYALIVALLIVAAVATLGTTGGRIATLFSRLGTWVGTITFPS